MKQFFTLLLFAVFLISCSREDDPKPIETEDSLVRNIKIDLGKSGTWINTHEINFYFEYDSQERLIKKIGGFVSIYGSAGFNGAFSNDVYTSLTYSNSLVTVENFSSSSEFTVPKDTKLFTLNAQQQIVTKEIPSDNSYLDKKLYYTYVQNKLTEILTTYPNMPYDPNDPNDFIWTTLEKFSYDSNDNLIKTETFNQNDGVNVGERTVRTFEAYDTSYNPTKKFYLLDEYFYRSISKNNYRKYTESRYFNDELYGLKEITWVFNYDANGNIILN